MTVRAGIIGVQGDVSEHASAIEQAANTHGEDVAVTTIRRSGIVPECDVLALPGGESTTISRLLDREGIDTEIVTHVEAGKPLLATCAGLIVVARTVDDDRVNNLGLLDVEIERNVFGRQRDSFEASIPIKGLDQPFPSVFIRAPAIIDVGDDVEVLATIDDRILAVREEPILGTAFHPELTSSSAIHHLAFFS